MTKLLAERLKGLMHKLVDRQQIAFIKNRRIMDEVLMANEYLDSRQKDKQEGFYETRYPESI